MSYEHIQEAARDAKQMEENSVLVEVSGDVEDIVTKAMYKAFQLGQDYWEQANSSYIEEYNKAPATNAKMIDLVDRARRDVVFILETAQGEYLAHDASDRILKPSNGLRCY